MADDRGRPRTRCANHDAIARVQIRRSGEPVACALGVLEAGFFGLFDVVTALVHRNKGYATTMLSSMLGWACARGAVHAYLGVVEANASARKLYGKLGYQEVYKYWYRIPTP